MQATRFFALIPIFIAAASCGSPTADSKTGSGSGAPSDTSGVPVETKKPNSNYSPAFPGQTRIAGIHTATGWNGTILTEELSHPWGIAALPDGRLLISEKGGTLRIAKTDGSISGKITGLPAVNDGGQGGLLDLAPDPDFTETRLIYWTFSERVSGGNLTAVAKGKLSADERRIENPTIIYRATPAFDGVLHYGGRIRFDKNGYLFVSTGERSDLQTRPQAQWLNSSLGKVLRITRDGKPAPGNPFEGRAGARAEIWSYGHRNVQGLAIHPETGELWESEFGPRGGDEINRIQAGKNYGWPTITYGIEYAGGPVGEGLTEKPGLEQPVYYWDPVVSPSGISFYSGKLIPEWKNNLFVSCLSGNHICRLSFKNGGVAGEERLLEKEGQRFRAITEGSDGALYAVTDEGRLYRIATK